MKNFAKIVSLSIVTLYILFGIISCDNATPDNTTDNLNTRALKKKVAVKAYHYKSLATFSKGNPTLELTDLAVLQNKQVNLVILYESIAPWANTFNDGTFKTTDNDNLNGLMSSYSLEIIKQFAIDDDTEGIIMDPLTSLENPIEAAKELSLIDHVLMVHVKEVPTTDNSIETADR